MHDPFSFNGFQMLQGASCNKYHVEELDYTGLLGYYLLKFWLLIFVLTRNLVNITMISSMPQAIYQVTVLLIFNFCGKTVLNLKNEPSEHANMVKNTVIFNGFVLCQVSTF